MSNDQPFSYDLPVDESRFHDPLYLIHAGWERIAANAPYPRKRGPFYTFDWSEGRTLPETCLAMVIAGQGELETRDRHTPLKAGDVFLLRTGEWHRHRPLPATGWSLMWIDYHGDEAQRWEEERRYLMDGNLARIENRPLFKAQFRHLMQCIYRNPTANPPNLARQLFGLAAHFLADPQPGMHRRRMDTEDDMVNRAIDHIWSYSHRSIDVPAVAKHLGIARRTLDLRFAAARGHSVLDEIRNCRMARAKRLLQKTSASIKQVAYRSGFQSEGHLRQSFQKLLGISPSGYRAQADPS